MPTEIHLLDSELIFRFVIFIISLLTILKGVYYRNSPNRDALFGFTLFGYGAFLVTALLHNVEMSMGFAFGLFAVFSLLRYRTEAISLRDMTYLFMVIVIALMCSVAPLTLMELVVLNVLVFILTALAETRLLAEKTLVKNILYEKVELIKPVNRQALFSDLEQRTGLKVTHVEVLNINYLNDTAQLSVSYRS